MMPIPYPSIFSSESISTIFRIEREANNGVIEIFTTCLNAGFSRSKSAMAGEKE